MAPGCAGPGQHLVHRFLIGVPFFPVPPVLLRDLPLLLRGVLPPSNRASWVSLSICTQNFTTTAPQSVSSCSNSLIS